LVIIIILGSWFILIENVVSVIWFEYEINIVFALFAIGFLNYKLILLKGIRDFSHHWIALQHKDCFVTNYSIANCVLFPPGFKTPLHCIYKMGKIDKVVWWSYKRSRLTLWNLFEKNYANVHHYWYWRHRYFEAFSIPQTDRCMAERMSVCISGVYMLQMFTKEITD